MAKLQIVLIYSSGRREIAECIELTEHGIPVKYQRTVQTPAEPLPEGFRPADSSSDAPPPLQTFYLSQVVLSPTDASRYRYRGFYAEAPHEHENEIDSET